MKKKILCLLLALVMTVGLLPLSALAAEDVNTSEPVTQAAEEAEEQPTEVSPEEEQAVEAPKVEAVSAEEQDGETETPVTDDTVSVTFKGISKKLVKLEVYAYQDGQAGTEVLQSITVNSTAVEMSAGDYWVKGYDSADNCCGGIKVTVQSGETNTVWLHIGFYIQPQNSGWVEGEDYTTVVEVKDASANECVTETGIYDSGSTTTKSCLVPHKGSFTATYTPTEKRADEGYVASSVTKSNVLTDMASPTNGAAIKLGRELKVHAPLGSTISAGFLKQSYYYYFAKSTVETKDDEVIATFIGIPEDAPVFVRVQHPDGVTYWNFADIRNDTFLKQGLCGKMNDDGEVVITADDLHIGDSSFTKSTLYRFEKSDVDRGDIYLNINAQGYKSMTVGETFNLNVFRNWQAIEGFGNAYIALPDMHYQVVDVNGQPSDIVTITPDANNSSTANMTANKAGTAIVLITYDSMLHPWGTGNESDNKNGEFTAIWPECTGVFVVTVDEDGTGIQTNMTIDRMDAETGENGNKIDAEHDFLFYLGDEGADYSFKPEDGCTVSVARSTVGDKMTFNGFTTDGVSVADDGTVTVNGLTTGRHIIKVEKNGVANYQVITAREVTLKLLDENENELPMDTKFEPGDKVTLQFWGLLNPQEKLATAYNFNFKLHMKGSDGTYFDSDAGSEYGVYNFSSSPELQRITITIPEDWDGITYQLAGALSKGGFAGHATHREITYGTGRAPVFDADSATGILTRLPKVTLRMKSDVTGLVNIDGQIMYYTDGELDTSVTGVARLADGSDSNWYYVENGIFKEATGIAQRADGSNNNWYYVENGIYKKATGIARYADGSSKNWYYVEKGQYKKSTGIARYADGSSKDWYYVQNGKYIKATGIAQYADGSSNNWYFVKNGKYTKTTGLTQKADGSSKNWYYVSGGRYRPDYTGLAPRIPDGKLFYVKNGVYRNNFNGTVKYQGKTYTVKNGRAV